jgi:hypothetical protein
MPMKDKDFYTNHCDGLPRDGVLRSLDHQIDAFATRHPPTLIPLAGVALFLLPIFGK